MRISHSFFLVTVGLASILIDPMERTLLGVNSQAELEIEIDKRVTDTILNPSHRVHSQPSWYKWSTLTQEYIPKCLIDESYKGNEKVLVHLSENPIHRAGPTGVFSINEMPDTVIKYHLYCKSDLDYLDAIVLESFFMEKLARAGICPRVHYYSDYMQRIPHHPLIPQLLVGKVKRRKCRRSHQPANIRFMIMDKVGISVGSWARYHNPTFINVMRAGAQMIVLLKKLHSWNVLHGDAHWGNFAFKSGKTGDLVLLDFGRSRIINEAVDYAANGGKIQRFCKNVDNLHIFNSKWEMKSCNPAFRDDVYRAVQIAQWQFTALDSESIYSQWLKRHPHKRNIKK